MLDIQNDQNPILVILIYAKPCRSSIHIEATQINSFKPFPNYQIYSRATTYQFQQPKSDLEAKNMNMKPNLELKSHLQSVNNRSQQ